MTLYLFSLSAKHCLTSLLKFCVVPVATLFFVVAAFVFVVMILLFYFCMATE